MSSATAAPSRWASQLGVAGYEYGNTRLRARRGALLTRDQLRELGTAGSPERFLGALRSTSYGPAVEHALAHQHVLHRVDTAVRDHLARQLADVRRFYTGRPLSGVDLLLGKWDLRNLLAIVRARSHPGAPSDLTGVLVPAGVLDRTALGELERQPSLRSVVDLMVAWDLPTRDTARRLVAAWHRSADAGRPAAIEELLTVAWAEAIAAGLEDWRDTDLEHLLRAEIDRINVLSALRRGADGAPTPTDPLTVPLAGGTIPDTVIEAAQRSQRPDEIADLVVRHRPGWTESLEQWVRRGDLAELDGRLQRALARWAIGRFVRGDPLGIAIPLAFVRAKEAEAANVRLIGRAIVHRLAWEDIAEDLVP